MDVRGTDKRAGFSGRWGGVVSFVDGWMNGIGGCT